MRRTSPVHLATRLETSLHIIDLHAMHITMQHMAERKVWIWLCAFGVQVSRLCP